MQRNLHVDLLVVHGDDCVGDGGQRYGIAGIGVVGWVNLTDGDALVVGLRLLIVVVHGRHAGVRVQRIDDAELDHREHDLHADVRGGVLSDDRLCGRWQCDGVTDAGCLGWFDVAVGDTVLWLHLHVVVVHSRHAGVRLECVDDAELDHREHDVHANIHGGGVLVHGDHRVRDRR